MIKEKGKSIVSKKIIKILGDDFLEHTDAIAVEEPLQISMSVLKADSPITNKNISITMRTRVMITTWPLDFCLPRASSKLPIK